MSDLISRQAAIDALNSLQKFSLMDSNEYMHGVGVRLKFAVQTLEQLPSAQTERERGEWENVDGIYKLATCSKCKKITMFETWGNEIRAYDFCPNCGADMRDGEADDESRIN